MLCSSFPCNYEENPFIKNPATLVFLYNPPTTSAAMARLSALLVLFLSTISPTTLYAAAQNNPPTAASTEDGYIGYKLRRDGDQDSAVYETSDTPSNATAATLPPDVYLNASVHVGELDINVQNLTAQINIAAQVLSLLKFNAGVDASIDRVSLTIQNVTAEVMLEARLENLVRMIDDVLDSLDLNPLLATIGQDVGQIANTTVGALNGAGGGGGATTTTNSGATKRDDLEQRSGLEWELDQGILYSVNDYSGNTHTNRILDQNGDIVEQKLHNDGTVYHRTVVGNYLKDMSPTGYDMGATIVDGEEFERELEYVYSPVPGISAVCAVFVAGGSDGDQGNGNAHRVVKTQVLAELRAGGGSTVSGQLGD